MTAPEQAKAEGAPEEEAPKDPEAAREQRLEAEGAARLEKERDLLKRLLGAFPPHEAIVGRVEHAGQVFITVTRDALLDVAAWLRDEEDERFSMLVDVTCADYLKLPELAPERFGLLYILYSFRRDTYARLRVYVGADDAVVPSLHELYPGAVWPEREVFDLYGVQFEGSPDARRILLPDYYTGHPLRKDYPLKGRGERDAFPVVTRRES